MAANSSSHHPNLASQPVRSCSASIRALTAFPALARPLRPHSDRCSLCAGHVCRAVVHVRSLCDRPLPDRLSSHTCSFSAAHFLGHCFRANSCALQLRVYCFPGSSRTMQAPPIKQTLALGAEASRFWVPQKNGTEKGDISMSYLYVNWNSFGLWSARRRSRHRLAGRANRKRFCTRRSQSKPDH